MAKLFPDAALLAPLIAQGLSEDVGQGDVTSQLLVPETATARLVFAARVPLVAAGLPLIALVYRQLGEAGQQVTVTQHVEDGSACDRATILATVEGPARALLTGERLALNLIQRASGVASLTRRYVDAVAGTGVEIRDTRKTIPGLRVLDKYAVTCGGGVNHRMRLDDMILIKDNHIALCGSVREAVARAQAGNRDGLPIEVECDTLMQFGEALECGPDWVLLDNMPPSQLREAVAMRKAHAQGKAVKLEASGGVTLDAVRAIAETGVDAISIGALTHSAVAVDIGLDVMISDAVSISKAG